MQNTTKDVKGRAKDKIIEPSKVVVLPDVAVRGTDSNNMQIKELKSQKSHGIWLAVHIPDNSTTLRPVKILSTKKAAEDLEKVIGPNRETMFKELQTIIGVDSATLRKMLKSGQIDDRKKQRKMHKVEDDDDEDSDGESDEDEEDEEDEEKEEKGKNEEKEEEEKEEDDSGEDDKKCEDEEDEESEDEDEEEDEEEEDDKYHRKHKNHQLKNRQKNIKSQSKQMNKTSSTADKKPKLGKKCTQRFDKAKMLPWTLDDGSGTEKNESAVFQPQGYKTPLANLLNKIHVRLKRKKACKHAKNPIIKELCKQMNRHHRHPRPNFNQPRRHLHLAHKKYYRHLRRLMRKFLNRHTGAQARRVLQYMNLLLSDQLRLSPDGIVHLYPNRGARPNSYGDGFKALVNDNSGTRERGQGTPPLEPPIIDDSMYNGHVIRVPMTGSTRGTTTPEYGIMSNSQANILNNQVHTKLGDVHSDADMQMQMLKDELGRSNEELREQQREKARDEAIMDKYMFNLQSLAEKGPVTNWDGMQKDAEERVNGQQVSVVDQDQISLKQSRLPLRNRPDIPSLGGYVGDQFTGFTRRNQIENYLKSKAKQMQHQYKRKSRNNNDKRRTNIKHGQK